MTNHFHYCLEKLTLLSCNIELLFEYTNSSDLLPNLESRISIATVLKESCALYLHGTVDDWDVIIESSLKEPCANRISKERSLRAFFE